MSHFNYPRINFSGNCFMDPATANNSWWIPLVIFDAIEIKHLLPPRIYLQDEYLMKGVTIESIQEKLPEGCFIKEDETTRLRGANFFEILPIKTETDFKEWARIPLGESDLDKDYWHLYELFWVPTNRSTLKGAVPGYWNYYGSMSYAYKGVRVSSVATGVKHQKEIIYEDSSENMPIDVREILDAKINMNRDPFDNSTNACVMVDHLPTMAMHTQLFVDNINLLKNEKLLMRGRPMKGSLRIINAFRVVNQNMPFAGSGVFYSVIKIDDLDEEDSTFIKRFFKKYGDSNKKLQGVFVRQIISEVEERRDVDYRITGSIPNPAYGKLSGSLTPWYDGDMLSWPKGRQLVGDAPYILGKNKSFDAPVSMMTPCVFNLNHDLNILQLDVLNNFPLQNKKESEEPIEPKPFTGNEYETYPLGQVEFNLEHPEENSDEGFPIGTIDFSESTTPRDEMYKNGGMVNFALPLDGANAHVYDKWNLNAYATNNKGQRVRIWKESAIVIMTDQAALYCSRGDDPAKGYRSYTGVKEHCYLRMFERGKPLKKAIDVSVIEIKMNISGSQKSEDLHRITQYKDGDIVAFGTYEPLNAIYVFLPYKTTVLPPHPYPSLVVQTGFFINLKVLPMHHFGEYLDPTHPDYPKEVTFKVMYEKIFKTFSLLSPTMIFHEERFENPFMAFELVKRTSHDSWHVAGYMPATRDLSDDQLALIRKWAEKFQEKAIELKKDEQCGLESSHDNHHKHLGNTDYFVR